MKTIDYQIFKFFILLLFISSCGIYTELPSKDFYSMLKNTNERSNEKLNFNGCYHHIQKENYHYPTDYKNGKPTRYVDIPYVDNPIFFFDNNSILLIGGLELDSIEFATSLLNYGTIKRNSLSDWGVYEIQDNIIKAIIYMPFYGGFPHATHRLQCHFEGIIKNKDTIQNWHLVQPYPPTFSDGGNGWLLNLYKTPRDLDFKSFPIKQLVNSDKAWINEFRGLREADLKDGKKRRKKYP